MDAVSWRRRRTMPFDRCCSHFEPLESRDRLAGFTADLDWPRSVFSSDGRKYATAFRRVRSDGRIFPRPLTFIFRHVGEVSKNPQINVEKLRKTTYLHEFDRELQCPTWSYPTYGSYYRDAQCSDSLLAVRVPLFALNARDDPVSHRRTRDLAF